MVPIQSLIDHIKTAVDVDPWAKEMAEELLKKQEPMEPIIDVKVFQYATCRKCGQRLRWLGNYCHWCGQAVKWE